MHFTRWATQSFNADAEVTVFCAVWHRQRNKLDWLASHYANLRGQTIPVRMIYIFDAADTPPDWLDADVYVFSEPLAIYEAWAAASAFCTTPWLMNLNIDDRLATNATELLLGAARASSALLVGGEWTIEFDTTHLDQPFTAPLAGETQFIPDWPPRAATGLRLGSGTGERGTFGPATLWCAGRLGKFYPSTFGNGEPIRSIGDTIFWSLLQNRDLRRVRVPIVIGRYLSEPGEQAEFRQHADWDLLKAHGLAKTSFAERILSGDVSERPRGQAA